MTKTVRIENACTSKFKVLVTLQELQYDYDKNVMGTEWVTIKKFPLDHPTFMLTDYLTTTRRFIVEENGVLDT